MNDTEKQKFLRALTALKLGPQIDGNQYSYDDFVSIHLQYKTKVHGTPLFLPWHRALLSIFEQHLQRIDPDVFVPYWDWGSESQTPELSSIFYSSAFGGHGPACIPDGIAQGWVRKFPDNDPNLAGSCLCRLWTNGKIGPLMSNDQLQSQVIPAYNDFASFAPHLEIIHGAVHVLVGGGPAGDLWQMYSPNDPIFYLHHSNVDRIWELWQSQSSQHLTDFSEDKSQILEPFSIVLSDVLDNAQNCIQYGPTGAPSPGQQIQPPSPSGSSVVSLAVRRARPPGSGDSNNPVRRRLLGSPLVDCDLDKRDSSMQPYGFLAPLPPSWADMNNISLQKVREVELLHETWIRQRNNRIGHHYHRCRARS
ncbi:uncharacterized protein BJ171DRAFT_498422 [Polychytrium aggregatum]|uniref:uncharacterized protein n=1 Tax=Polychytrium aggregatum TaxID=110093 RepID=UPI0022FF41F2|nr:uncharacterized protein BJ171DRAFT_498422 [Polychytrium aggregatum]KAI9206015.1 hypothetical protein BJ171DRAFT_498422 [Polychytrium aggregatum]